MARSPRSYAPSTDALNSRLERASTSCRDRPFCRRIALRRSPTRAPLVATPTPSPCARIQPLLENTSTLRESHASLGDSHTVIGSITGPTGPMEPLRDEQCCRDDRCGLRSQHVGRQREEPDRGQRFDLAGVESALRTDHHGPGAAGRNRDRGRRVAVPRRDDDAAAARDRRTGRRPRPPPGSVPAGTASRPRGRRRRDARGRRRARASSQRTTERRGADRLDTRDAELGELRDHGLELGSLRERHRDHDRRKGLGFDGHVRLGARASGGPARHPRSRSGASARRRRPR